ncbi:MAG: HmuY family protein [Nitrospinota bacterium]|nr:HmuY family protein [Nitrospinota bacterium]
MSNSFDSSAKDSPPTMSPEIRKKKKLWRNLFILNLCITILLIGLFWLPVKLEQMGGFLDSPSMKDKQANGLTRKFGGAQSVTATNTNLLPASTIVIDATNEEEWTYFDFSRGQQVKIHDPSSLEWDLAFRRGKIITNGGATNKFGQSGLMDLGEVSFEAVENVPFRDFIQDKATSTETENPVLVQWYKYNFITHKLTARKNIYVVRTADGKYAKIQFMSFYCADKQPGCIQMKYVYQNEGTKSFLKDNSGSFSSTTVATSPDISDS